ncbi:iron transporter Smf3p [[Candida] railenensis]|uniref:Iron transporter Smf3p n=1 Tax=[Candida] railenensis TaxID=45579 RepID=A0A9P0VXL8_9ASCO|nr:iron transporter Smf3p [[Candida] railenensis]
MSTIKQAVRKYASFIGPGVMVSVAYMDPGNYSTAVSSGATYEYKLLFIVFMSNLFAVILQCLCVKLGTVTGLDLAEMCRLHLPPWLNLILYLGSELAIVATDLAEVVGTAISLEILFGIPMFYGVLLTVLDVLVVLVAYNRDGSMKQTRIFEILVSVLVASTCICFIVELFKCDFAPGSMKAIVKGFLPLDAKIFKEANALFLSCGIVGSTVMPHSLFLGSALVQPRLKDYDEKHGLYLEEEVDEVENVSNGAASGETAPVSTEGSKSYTFGDSSELTKKYKPSYQAIQYCLNYSYAELVLSLFIIAVFVNAAILIVAGSTLFGKPDAEDADLLSIYEMLSIYISPAAGIIFALSMLFSGQSAGIVCTMAGQIVSEGFINWSLEPWIRRLFTRAIAVVPVLIVISILGREGVSKIMNSSQVVLSFILPLVTAPLIWFTTNKKYMVVHTSTQNPASTSSETTTLLHNSPVETFENGPFFTISAILTWVIISFLNLYLIYAFANGADI